VMVCCFGSGSERRLTRAVGRAACKSYSVSMARVPARAWLPAIIGLLWWLSPRKRASICH